RNLRDTRRLRGAEGDGLFVSINVGGLDCVGVVTVGDVVAKAHADDLTNAHFGAGIGESATSETPAACGVLKVMVFSFPSTSAAWIV
ncbi:hypothetical protein HT105_24550, partial [Bacteroides fragilis]|nr:hypothetical protein [Bacteroides fragilis]